MLDSQVFAIGSIAKNPFGPVDTVLRPFLPNSLNQLHSGKGVAAESYSK